MLVLSGVDHNNLVIFTSTPHRTADFCCVFLKFVYGSGSQSAGLTTYCPNVTVPNFGGSSQFVSS